MQNSYFDHPTEEELESFLLHPFQGEETGVVETHILACEACVARLEALETEIPALKWALERLEAERAHREAARAEGQWRKWFTVPRLSWAAGAAVLLLGIALAPQFERRTTQPPAEVSLVAYRGAGTPAVPLNRPLHIRLNARDLAEGPVTAQIVNSDGSEVWKGTTTVRREEVDIRVPKIQEAGAHFLRLYALAHGNGQANLLREFAFKAK